MLLWVRRRGTFPAEFEAGSKYLKLLSEINCLKIEHVLIRDLMNADRTQRWHTQTRYVNYIQKDRKRGWQGSRKPCKGTTSCLSCTQTYHKTA